MRILIALVMVTFLCGTAEAQLFKKEKAKVDAATAQIAVLDQAVMAYRVKNANYPPALDVLVKDMFVEAKAIVDPWDKKFHYDPLGMHNDQKKPDIWTRTPFKTIIANWSEFAIDGKKLLGKWEGGIVLFKGSGRMRLEFSEGGKMKLTITVGAESESNAGEYTLEGNELSMTGFGKKDEKMVVTITKLTENELQWRNDEAPVQGQFQSFKRVKEAQK